MTRIRLTGEEDLFAVGRPAGAVVVEGVIGDFGERAAGCGNDPDVGVLAIVEGFSSAIGDEGDARAVGRPLRVAVVPVLAIGDLFGIAAGKGDDPQMAALVVVPTGVIELVLDMRVVVDVALAIGRGDGVGRTGRTDGNDAGAVG